MRGRHLDVKRVSRSVLVCFAIAGVALTAGAGAPLATAAPAGATTVARASTPPSIVQLGDSIASGEGTLYGYTYDTSTMEWTGGNINAKWPGPYPLCHDSPDAYGNVVAADLGTTLHQFACTGASFDNGITVAQTSSGETLRPAQFGNWTAGTELNPQYDAAMPDVVMVTLGADDVKFVKIIESCIENALFNSPPNECIATNPGPTVQSDFFDELPFLRGNLVTLVRWIEARGRADGRVPKIVFTNYDDPLPPAGVTCPDTYNLSTGQLTYLRSLVDQMNGLIVSTIQGLHDRNVAVADVSQAFAGHTWCTTDPWAYGLSITFDDPGNFFSQAPFHPTPHGQQVLASKVEPVVTSLLYSTPAPVTAAGGYRMVASDGGVFAFGSAGFFGSMGGTPLASPIVGMTPSPDGKGYWLVARDGGVFAFGDAPFEGSLGGQTLDSPVVSMAATSDGGGYWLVAADGSVSPFGDARYFGSMAGRVLAAPIVGMAPTPDGAGYWLVASDGGVFAFGDARAFGSMGGQPLAAPIVGMAPTPDGAGYWLVASDGGVFAYGDAPYLGSMGGIALNRPVVGMAPTPDGTGYRLVAADGGIFAFGSASYLGSMGGTPLVAPVVGMGG